MSYFAAFDVSERDSDGAVFPLAGESIDVYEVGGSKIDTLVSDDYGHIEAQDLSVDPGTQIEFRHLTFTGTFRQVTYENEIDAFSPIINFIVNDNASEFREPTSVQFWIQDLDDLSNAPVLVGTVAPGVGISVPFDNLYERNVRIYAVSGDGASLANPDFETAEQADLTIPAKTVPTVSDAPYDATTWNGNTDAPTKNAVRDKFESLDLSSINGTVPISKGGTGQATANAALNAILPAQFGQNGKVLQTNGSNSSWANISWGTISGTLSAQTDLQTALDAKANLSGAVFTGHVELSDKNFIFGTTTGTKIGTDSTQKLSFHGATPSAQDTGWSVSGYSTRRTFNNSTDTIGDFRDMICTYIQKMIDKGLIG